MHRKKNIKKKECYHQVGIARPIASRVRLLLVNLNIPQQEELFSCGRYGAPQTVISILITGRHCCRRSCCYHLDSVATIGVTGHLMNCVGPSHELRRTCWLSLSKHLRPTRTSGIIKLYSPPPPPLPRPHANTHKNNVARRLQTHCNLIYVRNTPPAFGVLLHLAR